MTANTFRHPAMLAKMATTIDQMSGGRLDVGLGAGWMDAEHSQFGMVLPSVRDRLRMLDEACQVMIALWTQEKANFEGEHYQLRDALHEPKPIQAPHPPIVIGGSGEKVTMRIAAKYAAEWNFSGGTPEMFAHKCRVLDEHCASIGRDPSTIERSTQFRAGPTASELIDLSRQFIAAGATHLIYTCPQPYSAEGARWLWNEVVTPLRG